MQRRITIRRWWRTVIGKGDILDMLLIVIIAATAISVSVLLERVLYEFLIY